MPVDLFAAAVAPKVAMAFAVADTPGAEDAAMVDASHHHVSATSFIDQHGLRLPMPRSTLMKMLLGPEITAYNWLHDKVDGVWHNMFGGHATPDQARMVDYYAAGCPHCQHLEPAWKQAAADWSKDPEAAKVVWEQKQCLDENWKPGADYKECQEQQIMGFPTVKFFPQGSQTGDAFFFERTPTRLVEFAKTGIHPDPSHLPVGEGEMADVKMVDYYSAACPHCKSLDPIWADAEKKWDASFAGREDGPAVSFEKRECYDDHWKPGKDFAECKQLNIHSFPNIKLLTAAEDGHGFVAKSDFSGKRNAEGIVNFLREQTGLEEPSAPDQAVPHADNAIKVAGSIPESDGHHVVPTIPNEEIVKEPSAPIVGTEVLTPKAAETVDGEAPAGEGEFADIQNAVKAAMAPLPLVGLSCLPGRRSHTHTHKRVERSSAHKAPTTSAQFL